MQEEEDSDDDALDKMICWLVDDDEAAEECSGIQYFLKLCQQRNVRFTYHAAAAPVVEWYSISAKESYHHNMNTQFNPPSFSPFLSLPLNPPV